MFGEKYIFGRCLNMKIHNIYRFFNYFPVFSRGVRCAQVTGTNYIQGFLVETQNKDTIRKTKL